jgi:hypothetical protein
MSNFTIEVLAITGPTKNVKGKQSWRTVEIAYKKDGKVEGKKLVDFNNKDVFELVCQAKQGEVYDVISEKKGDFWQWEGFSKAGEGQDSSEGAENDSASSDAPAQEKPPVRSQSTGRVTGSNYETPEERALRRGFEAVKHRQIGKQGCLNIASTLLLHNSEGAVVSEEAVIELSKKFEQYVFGMKTLKEAIDAVKGMVDDIPV